MVVINKIKLFIFTSLLLLTIGSCGYPYCDRYRYKGEQYGVSYNYDYFSASKLIGLWQIDYGCNVGSIELKEIKFFNGSQCDIVFCRARDTDWYEETWSYLYNGKTIRLNRNDGETIISFRIRGYISPELYLEDSFGKYIWRKLR